VPLLCRSLSRRSSSPQPPSPFAVVSCRGPECRCPAHGTATPRPWEARTPARACAPAPCGRAVPPPCRAAARPRPHRAAPRLHHDPIVRGHPQRGHDVAFVSRPSPFEHFLEHALDARELTHTRPPWAEPHRIWQPHQIRWETDKRALPVGGKRGALHPGPVSSERERGRVLDRGWPVRLSRPARLASPRIRAGLLSRRPSWPVKPSRVSLDRLSRPNTFGPRTEPCPFFFFFYPA
jgi:hypothetical protein